MNAKQKLAVYGSTLLLAGVGIVFLIKGWQRQESILLLIGLLLLTFGIGRGVLFKKYLSAVTQEELSQMQEKETEEEDETHGA